MPDGVGHGDSIDQHVIIENKTLSNQLGVQVKVSTLGRELETLEGKHLLLNFTLDSMRVIQGEAKVPPFELSREETIFFPTSSIIDSARIKSGSLVLRIYNFSNLGADLTIDFPELESELLLEAIRKVDGYFARDLKAPLPTVVTNALASRAEARVNQLRAEELFQQQFFKGLSEARKMPAPEEVPVARRKQLQALADRGQRLLRSQKIKPFFSEQELRVLKKRARGLSFQKIGQQQKTPVSRQAVRVMYKQAAEKLLLLAEGKKLPQIEPGRKPLSRAELKAELERLPGQLSYQQKVSIKRAESRGVSSLLKKAGFGKPPFARAERDFLRRAIEALPAEEKKLIKFLYALDWGFEKPVVRSFKRRAQAVKTFNLSWKELAAREKEIIAKLGKILKGKPHSPGIRLLMVNSPLLLMTILSA